MAGAPNNFNEQGKAVPLRITLYRFSRDGKLPLRQWNFYTDDNCIRLFSNVCNFTINSFHRHVQEFFYRFYRTLI